MTDTRIFPRAPLRDEAEARRIIEALPVAVYATDAEGHITYYNAAAEALWGRAPAYGKDRWCGSAKLFTADGRPLAHDECPMAQILKGGEAARGQEIIIEGEDGTRVRVAPFPAPLLDDAGQLVGA